MVCGGRQPAMAFRAHSGRSRCLGESLQRADAASFGSQPHWIGMWRILMPSCPPAREKSSARVQASCRSSDQARSKGCSHPSSMSLRLNGADYRPATAPFPSLVARLSSSRHSSQMHRLCLAAPPPLDVQASAPPTSPTSRSACKDDRKAAAQGKGRRGTFPHRKHLQGHEGSFPGSFVPRRSRCYEGPFPTLLQDGGPALLATRMGKPSLCKAPSTCPAGF